MKPKKRKKYYILPLFFFTIALFMLLFSALEQKMQPPLKEISHMKCKALANKIIDDSASEILSEMELTEKALLSPNLSGEGYIANTALVNHFCSRFSASITEDLVKLPDEKIGIPLGAVMNWGLFANIGPEIPFTLIPMGAVKVDYDSQFLSVGINQINYKIWLNIAMELKIVNPLYQENITLERKIMLADIVFSGKVPEHYFQMTYPNEYLLTE